MNRRKIQGLVGCCVIGFSMVALLGLQRGLSFQGPGRAKTDAASGNAPRAAGRAGSPKPVEFNIAPETNVADPYPTWNGIAVDPENGVVAMSDLNRHGLFLYDRMAHSDGVAVTPPLRHISGRAAGMGFVAGLQMDPEKRVVYIAENDGWGMRTFSYDDDGDTAPRNLLATPHQVWGIGLSKERKEMVVGVEELHSVLVYRQDATKLDPPLRVIRGQETGIADPHGVYLDGANKEILVVNHGNWAMFHPNTDHDEMPREIPISPGHFDNPSIRVFPVMANGDVKPIRTIQGDKTQLNWPMQMDVDRIHNEIAIANFGGDSIIIFRRTDQGNVEPIRVLKGENTGIEGPVGVALDLKNDEIWVANYGDHTAVVFPRTASGNVAPKRIIRNAPAESPTCGFTNASSATYDTKRKEVLIANCVSVPRIAAWGKTATGEMAPTRAIQGQATKLSRTVHGLDYDAVNDEIIAPVYEAAAVLVYRGGANGAEAPLRLIQGTKTMLLGPQTASVDPVHNEILVGDASSGSILVYDRMANGNVPPKRIIRGPATGLREITGIAADPKRNLILVVNMGATHDEHGVFIFNRMDNGNVAPKAIIGGEEAGISHARQLVVDSERGKIYVAVQGTDFRGVRPYVEAAPRKDTVWGDVLDNSGRDKSQPSWSSDARGFIGVWDISDHGNVPPRAVIKGLNTMLTGCGGVAISPADGLIVGVGNNMYTTYLIPQFFTENFWQKK